jgi:hypothetical protein
VSSRFDSPNGKNCHVESLFPILIHPLGDIYPTVSDRLLKLLSNFPIYDKHIFFLAFPHYFG